MRCYRCNAPLSEDQEFCGHCGARQPRRQADARTAPSRRGRSAGKSSGRSFGRKLATTLAILILGVSVGFLTYLLVLRHFAPAAEPAAASPSPAVLSPSPGASISLPDTKPGADPAAAPGAAEPGTATPGAENPGGAGTLPVASAGPGSVGSLPGESQLAGGMEGRWLEDAGRWELWIQSVDEEIVTFSLFAPGATAVNNVRAERLDGESIFYYEDPFHAGNWAEGNLTSDPEDGALVMNFTGWSQGLPLKSTLRFSSRSDRPDYRELYAPVLEAYREHERSGGGLENWYGDEPGYVHVGISSLPRLGTMYADLDGNGVPELILGGYYSEEDFASNPWLEPGSYFTNLIVDLYTLDGETPVYLVNSGDRYRYNLTDDGMLYYEGSSGAAYSSEYLYRVDGTKLVFVTGVCIDGSEDRCFLVLDDTDYQHERDKSISFEEFCSRSEELAAYQEDHACPLLLRPLLED